MNGIATTMTAWHAGIARRANPPRTTTTKLDRGSTLGKPHDVTQQRRILDATLALLAQDAPLPPVSLKETME
jgi:hypothetical protein